ncbi:ankyrin repeat domain-containing protein [Wolbachia endosymbiont of Tetranychus urticae]|uniref:ankyrin repeat domain-containing protein n=1 Tax=Wolbachia endosymbiont of Tetranychus urticae TaxID=169184 RepID=UPI00397C33B3
MTIILHTKEEIYPHDNKPSEQEQLNQEFSLKRFKRFNDIPELPQGFRIGEAIGDGDCFFDAVAQGLKQSRPEMVFTAKSLRKICQEFAQTELEKDQSWLREALEREVEPIEQYIPRIELTADDINQGSELARILGLNSPIWGRSEIEGRIICQKYNVKLHIIEKYDVDGKEIWTDQIVDKSSSRSVGDNDVDYNDANTIHVINSGKGHFEPIIRTQEIQPVKSMEQQTDLSRSNLERTNNEPQPESSNANRRNQQHNTQPRRFIDKKKLPKLVDAMNKGDFNLFKSLLRGKVDLNARVNINNNVNDNTLLHYAARNGVELVMQEILQLEQKIDVNIRNKQGDTPLHAAVLSSKRKVVSLLLNSKLGVDVNARNNQGDTPLHVAAKNGKVGIVRELLESQLEINVNAQNEQGDTPLHVAVRENKEQVVQRLLKTKFKKVDVNAQNKQGDSPLHVAVRENRKEIFQELLKPESKVDVNAQNKQGDSPLHVAVRENRKEIFQELLKPESKVDVNAQNKQGDSPLHVAVRENRKEIFQELLKPESKVDVNAQNKQGDSPLHVAVRENRKEIVQEMLKLESKVDVNAQNKQGRTILHVAAEYSNVQIVRKLLETKWEIDVSARDKEGDTPLHLAIVNDRIRIVEELLGPKWGTNVNAQNKQGDTPLHFAIRESKQRSRGKTIVKKLLNLDSIININILNKEDGTPLHLAVSLGDLAIVQMLLDPKLEADVNSKNFQGQTPLDIANEFSRTLIINALSNAKRITNKSGINDAENNFADSADSTFKHQYFDASPTDVGVKDANHTDIDKLNRAIQKGNFNLFKSCLTRVVNINTKNAQDHNNTPLHYAVNSDNKRIIAELLDPEREVNVNAINDEGNTPLHLAVKLKKYQALELLLGLGSRLNVNAQNKEGNTPLHIAVIQKDDLIVKDILALKGRTLDLYATNMKGETVLEIARRDQDSLIYNMFSGSQSGALQSDIPSILSSSDHQHLIQDRINAISKSDHGSLALEILNSVSYFANTRIRGTIFVGLVDNNDEKLSSVLSLLIDGSLISEVSRKPEYFLRIKKATQEAIRKQLAQENKEEKVLEKALGVFKNGVDLLDVRHAISVWDYASKYDKLVKEFNEIPMHILDLFPQSLIENGELYKFAKRACTALQNALGSDDPYTLLLKLKLFSVLQKTFESDRSRGITTNDDTAIIKEDFWEFNRLRKKGRLIFQNTKYEYLKAKFTNQCIEVSTMFLKLYKEAADRLGITELHTHALNLDEEGIRGALMRGEYYDALGFGGKTAKEIVEHVRYKNEKASSNIIKLIGSIEKLFNNVRNNNEKGVRDLLNTKDAKTRKVLLHTRNSGGKTALDVARSLISDLIDKIKDAEKRNSDGQTALDVAGLLVLEQRREGYERIAELLAKNLEFIPNLVGLQSLPGCSSTTTLGRRRRRANTCEWISSNDISKILEENTNVIDQTMTINSDLFLKYIQDESLSENKRFQLIQLAGKERLTGESSSLANKLISNQRVMSHLDRIGKVSGAAMQGMMAKNILADAVNGDYQGLAINLGFTALPSGVKAAENAALEGLNAASQASYARGFKLAPLVESSLAQSFKLSSSFLARGTSGFIAYDLYNEVKEYKKGNKDALVGVVGDSVYLGVDAAELGIEVAEGFGILEGVSSVTGPIGATIGAVVFVGTDIYQAVKKVENIDRLVHLTEKERFIEGIRAFLHVSPEPYIEELLREQLFASQYIYKAVDYLKHHTDVRKYVFPTMKSERNCQFVKTLAYPCTAISDSCGLTYLPKCVTKYITSGSHTAAFLHKMSDIRSSRAIPERVHGGELFCLPTAFPMFKGDYPASSEDAYICENAIGLEYPYDRTANYTYISLGTGYDKIIGFPHDNHVVVLEDGEKIVRLNTGDDTIILKGDKITGSIAGGSGINTLDLRDFSKQKHILIDQNIYITGEYGTKLELYKIHNFLLREDIIDSLVINDCETRYIDGRGGRNEENMDDIIVYKSSNSCSHDIKFVIRTYTKITNYSQGDFTYMVPFATSKGKAFINLKQVPGTHTFVFNYTLYDIDSIYVEDTTVKFNFKTDAGDRKVTPELTRINLGNHNYKSEGTTFSITIHGHNSPIYHLGDNSEIRIIKGELFLLQNSNKSVDEIINSYSRVANNLKMSIFVHSLLNNESIVVGHGKHDVIENNPKYKSHLVGNGGENIFVVTSDKLPIPEIVLYDLDQENKIDTLDLRQVRKQVESDLNVKLKARIITSDKDLIIWLFYEKDHEVSKGTIVEGTVVQVRLKNGLLTNWYERLHVIMNHVPMKIEEFKLRPLPLVFDNNEEIIRIAAEDVDKNNKIIISQKIEDYTFSKLENDLIMTFNNNASLILSEFYKNKEMETLTIRFANKEVTIKDELNNVRSFDDLKEEYRNNTANIINSFNNSTEATEASNSTETSVKSFIRNRRNIESNVKSAANRPTSFINTIASTFTNAVIGTLQGITQFISARTSASGYSTQCHIDDKPSNYKSSFNGYKPESSISQVNVQTDINSTILLLDLLIRRVTGQKYNSTAEQSISPPEARDYALSITDSFEKVLAKSSGCEISKLDFDWFNKLFRSIEGSMISGQYSKVPRILHESAKNICSNPSEKFFSDVERNIKRMLNDMVKENSLNVEKRSTINNNTPLSSLSKIDIEPVRRRRAIG